MCNNVIFLMIKRGPGLWVHLTSLSETWWHECRTYRQDKSGVIICFSPMPYHTNLIQKCIQKKG